MKRIATALLICIMITFIAGCSMLSNEYTKKETLNENLSGSTELQINNQVGSIQIKQSKGNVLTVDVTKKVRSNNKNKDIEIMDNIKVRLTKEGNKVILDAVTASDENMDIWTWKDKNLTNVNIAISYVINVPANIKIFNVTNDIGKINVNDVTGVFNIQNDLGDIKLSNLGIEGKSSIVTDNGDISASFNNIIDSENINLNTHLGNVDVKLPKNYDFKAEKDSSQSSSTVVNVVNDKTDINISTGVGSLKLNGKNME